MRFIENIYLYEQIVRTAIYTSFLERSVKGGKSKKGRSAESRHFRTVWTERSNVSGRPDADYDYPHAFHEVFHEILEYVIYE